MAGERAAKRAAPVKPKELDVVFNPIRWRILQALVNSEPLSARRLNRVLDDVPAATLYRHINRLVDGGILEVAEERKVGATSEKYYRAKPIRFETEDQAAWTAAQSRQAFTVAIAGLLDSHDRYVEQAGASPSHVHFITTPLYLSDEEETAFVGALDQLVRKAAKKRPAPGRTRRIVAAIALPAPGDA